MSQLGSCSSLKPTARWWFSRTDESLYMRASSESAHTHTHSANTHGSFRLLADIRMRIRDICVCECELTGVDEELVGDSRVVNIMDGSSKQSSQDL